MQPQDYTAIGGKVLGIKTKAGYNLSYVQKDISIDISADTNYKNPNFNGKFKLSAGDIEIGMPSEKPVELKIKPDLSAHNAKLTIYPLKEGQYQFELNKNICKLPLSFQFNSADSSYKFGVTPKFNYGPVAFDVAAEYDGKNVTTKCLADTAKVGIRTKYSQADNQVNLGVFSNLCCFNFGTTTAIDVTKLGVKEVKTYLGTFKKTANIGLVLNVFPTFGYELYAQSLLPKKYNFINIANSIVYSKENGYALKSGLAVNYKGCQFGAVCSDKLNLALYFKSRTYKGATLSLNGSVAKVTLDKKVADPKFGMTVTFDATNQE